MKKEYVNTELEIILFETNDVVTTSPGGENPPNPGDHGSED